MLSASNIKLIRSLQYKKYRDKFRLYVIEGDKLVTEFLTGGKQLRKLLALPSWIEKADKALLERAGEIIEVSQAELSKVSALKTAHETLALVEIENIKPEISLFSNKLTIALDDIRDPGNLGTIIRIAAWFGIDNIICSNDTVDLYNPKVIQASMGAMLHVSVFYENLLAFIPQLAGSGLTIYSAVMDGRPVYGLGKKQPAVLIFGNESRGISKELLQLSDYRISIPPYEKSRPGIESLNAAMSAAIICNEFRRT